MLPATQKDHTAATSNCARKLVLTTSWDDGDPLDIRVAELLSRYGLTGTFYVPCQNELRVLDGGTIRELAQSFEIGAHTVHHEDVTNVMDSIARKEIVDSKRWIEEATGKSCRAFCFPMGRFALRHLEMVREAGFATARTVEMLSFDAPQNTNGVALVPTTLQAFPHGKLCYWRNFAKRFRAKDVPILFAIGAATDWAAAAISLLGLAQERGGVFHVWGHSREIEESGQWKNLERVFRAMHEVKQDGVCVTNSELCDSVN